MTYLLQDRKRGVGKKIFIRIAILLAILFGAYFLLGAQMIAGLHGIQRGVAYVFGYYNDPVRPISQSSYQLALEADNASLKALLGRKDDVSSDSIIVATSTSSSTSSTASTKSTIQNTKAFKLVEDTILSVILSRPPHSPYDSLTIDIGEDKGLMHGDMVYAERHYLIGRVESVNPTTSIVKLFSTPGEKIDVLLGSSTIPVVAEGRGSGNFYIKVPRNIDVKEGDPITVPSFHSIVLGTAEKVDAGEGEAYTQIYFKLPVNINILKYVEIKKAFR